MPRPGPAPAARRRPFPAAPLREGDLAPLPREVTFTVDLEDHAPGLDDPPRFLAMTRRILAFLAERGAPATFFVTGEAARAAPGLVREVARAGHEVASHSHRHVPLGREAPASFRRGMAEHRRRLEDVAGAPVLGFRAPLFSLGPGTAWAAAELAALGFAYSSSVVPAPGFGPAGWPGAPEAPFAWPSGLLELPCPLGRVGPFRLPFLGGMYLRTLPPWRIREAARTVDPEGALWTYCHPYDFDTEEPWRRLPGHGRASSFFLRANRRLTAPRLDLLLRGRRPLAFRDRLAALAARARPFDPGAATVPGRAPARARAT